MYKSFIPILRHIRLAKAHEIVTKKLCHINITLNSSHLPQKNHIKWPELPYTAKRKFGDHSL